MSDGVTIDVGEAYPYIEQRVLQIFGKDAASAEERDWLKSLHETAANQASRVQCVGMANPVPFESIYQPTHLFRKGMRQTPTTFAYESRTQRSLLAGQIETFRPISLLDLLALGEDAIIFAGPGWGKTTFMSSVFRTILRNKDAAARFYRREETLAFGSPGKCRISRWFRLVTSQTSGEPSRGRRDLTCAVYCGVAIAPKPVLDCPT